MKSNIKYRFLDVEEWDKLEELCPPDKAIPSPMIASCVVAEVEDKLVGCLFLQMALHMEPLIVKDHQADYKELAKMIKSNLPDGLPFFSCAPDGKMEHIAEVIGMTRLNDVLYVGTGGER